MAERAVVDEAKARFELVCSAENEQRRRELEDLRFDAGDQWPDEVKAARGGQVVDGVPIPARPMLTIPKLDQPVQLILNQQKNARLGIIVSPDSEDADDDTAEVLQGLIRHIEVRSRANIARSWAFERAVKAGRGFYRILKQYVDDSGEDFDQELVIERILNQGSVYLDPYAQQPDWSDGEWALIGGLMPAEQYKREFPDSDLAGMLDETFSSLGDNAPDWMGETDDGEKAVRVMEYFKVIRTPKERVAYLNDRNQLVVAWADELPVDLPPDKIQQRRMSEQRQVKWYKLNAVEVLEEADWDGQYIPIIPVVGKEQNVDGQRKWYGVIHPAKDAQRLFNYAVSTAVETAALEPKAPFIGFEGQFEGHEAAWAQANVRNFPYLQVKPMTIGGQPAGLPERNVAGANLGPSLALVNQADDYIKATTFVYDPSLGSSAGARSGKAVLALQQQADLGNSNYLDNLASISMTYEAKVLLDLIPKVYDRPGRVARILGVDDEASLVMLNQPFVTNPRTGRPQPAPAQMPPMMGQMPVPMGPRPMGQPPMGQPGMRPGMAGMPPGQGAMPGKPQRKPVVKYYNLAQGKYTVTVSIGRAYRTRVEQGADEIAQVLQASPNLMPIIGDLYFKYRDFPGHREIADRLKRMVPPEAQEPKEEDDPAVLRAEAEKIKEESGQMIEQMTQQLNQLTEIIKNKQIEAQAQIEGKRIEAQSRENIAKMQADAQIAVAQIKTETQAVKAQLDTESRLLTQQREQQHAMSLEMAKMLDARDQRTPAPQISIQIGETEGDEEPESADRAMSQEGED